MRNLIRLFILATASAALFLHFQSTATEFNIKAPTVKSNTWINSEPLTWEQLKGQVVLVEFWTFECYNCVNVQPYVKDWYKKYKNKGLEVLAIHTPEFDRERKVSNVKNYSIENNLTYPIVIDNDFSNWKRFSNRYWPTMYLIDKTGQIRYRAIGEGNYNKTEQWIQRLINET